MKKTKLLQNKKAQAATELAVFASLIILGFSVVLMYGQRFDSQQQVKMETFRRALERAYNLNSSVTYTYKKDLRSYNLFSGFGQGQPSTVSATANVMWQKGMSGERDQEKSESFSYYVVNDQSLGDSDGKGLPRYPKKSYDYSGGKHDSWVPLSVYKEEQERKEVYSSRVTKKESPKKGFSNTRSSRLQDTLATKVHTRYDRSEDKDPWDKEQPLPQYVYEGDSYQYDNQGHTVAVIPETSHGAYYNPDKNRIQYSSQQAGNTIRQQRTWSTE